MEDKGKQAIKEYAREDNCQDEWMSYVGESDESYVWVIRNHGDEFNPIFAFVGKENNEITHVELGVISDMRFLKEFRDAWMGEIAKKLASGERLSDSERELAESEGMI